jgi:hypothetical protein
MEEVSVLALCTLIAENEVVKENLPKEAQIQEPKQLCSFVYCGL